MPLLTVPAEKMGGRIAASLVATLGHSLAAELVVRYDVLDLQATTVVMQVSQ